MTHDLDYIAEQMRQDGFARSRNAEAIIHQLNAIRNWLGGIFGVLVVSLLFNHPWMIEALSKGIDAVVAFVRQSLH